MHYPGAELCLIELSILNLRLLMQGALRADTCYESVTSGGKQYNWKVKKTAVTDTTNECAGLCKGGSRARGKSAQALLVVKDCACRPHCCSADVRVQDGKPLLCILQGRRHAYSLHFGHHG